MAVKTGYRSEERSMKTEEAPSRSEFGSAMGRLLSAGPEPDVQDVEDGRRLMGRPMTEDLSSDLPGAAKKIAAALMGRPTGRRVEAPCGCGRYTCCDEGKRLSRESQAAYRQRSSAYDGLVATLRAHRAEAEAAIATETGAA